MNVISIIKMLLQLVSFFVRKADEAQLRELGKDALVTQQLKEITARTLVAKEIAAEFASKSDADIDAFLRDHYRD